MAACVTPLCRIPAAVHLDTVSFIVRDNVAVDRTIADPIIQADADAFRTIVQRAAEVAVEFAGVVADRMARNGVLARRRAQLDTPSVPVRGKISAIRIADVVFDSVRLGKAADMNTEIHIVAAVIVAHIAAISTVDEDAGQHTVHGIPVQGGSGSLDDVDADGSRVRVVGDAGWRRNTVPAHDEMREEGRAGVRFAADAMRCGGAAAVVADGVIEQADVVDIAVPGDQDSLVARRGAGVDDVEHAAGNSRMVFFEDIHTGAIRRHVVVFENAVIAQPDDCDITPFRQGAVPDVQVAVGNKIALMLVHRDRGTAERRGGRPRQDNDRFRLRGVVATVRPIISAYRDALGCSAACRYLEDTGICRAPFLQVRMAGHPGNTGPGAERAGKRSVTRTGGSWIDVVHSRRACGLGQRQPGKHCPRACGNACTGSNPKKVSSLDHGCLPSRCSHCSAR